MYLAMEALESHFPFSPLTVEDLVVYFEKEQSPIGVTLLSDNEAWVEFS